MLYEGGALMAEYIERDCVRKIASMFFTMSMCASEDECRAMNRAIRIVEKRIDSIPAADVVPVVRCKFCRSQRWCKFAQYLGNDGFCSQGEYANNCGARMDGDGDV